MNPSVGDVILVLRRAAGITQKDLAEQLKITQAALSRYEHNLREPDPKILRRIGEALGVTADFLEHKFSLQGALAADAHMRRQKTTRPSDWKRIEARLNAWRMHASYLLERVPLRPQNHVIQIDPEDRSPAEAAEILRASWRMPVGPVRDLVRWVESAGVIVIEEDFGTHRIDGMSQWAGAYPVMLINSSVPNDRKRLTIAHELGHLVLHSEYIDIDVEEQANEFAASFLMPEPYIESHFTDLSLGQLSDLKQAWGVSMQALFERAYRMGKAHSEARTKFYRQMSKRGWRTREPGSESIPVERPKLAKAIGSQLVETGLSREEVSRLIGAQGDKSTPFLSSESHRGLRLV